MRDLILKYKLCAILRGMAPDAAASCAAAIYAGGIRMFEVALNSPDAYRQIEALRRSLPEDALIGAADSDEPVVALSIDSREQLQTFADCQHLIQKPLCLVCDDAVLLEQALRQYQGRALYEGGLSDEALLPLCERYGLIL